MPRPSKSILTLQGHRTKQEIAIRKQGEAGTLTGEPMREHGEVRNNLDAHKEFMRLRKLFRKIEKDDDIYSQTINRYCLLHSECMAIEGRKAKLEQLGNDAEDPKDALAFYKLVNDLDRELMSKRKMMMEIEDKNLMNIQSALRNIPKRPEDKKNPLKEALSG